MDGFLFKVEKTKHELRIYENTKMNILITLLAVVSLIFCCINKLLLAILFFFVFLILSCYKLFQFAQFFKGKTSYFIEGSKYSFENPRCFIVEENKDERS